MVSFRGGSSSSQTGAAPSLASDIFSNQGDRLFLTKKVLEELMNLQKLIHSVPGLVIPNLRIHPSNKAHYEDPREGEVVLFRKTKKSPAFNSTEMESKRTWTLTVHLSQSCTIK